MLSTEQIREITQGEVLQYAREYPWQHLLIDSRTILHPAGSLFFAIRGAYNNGHKYLAGLYDRGVRLFIIERVADIPGLQHPGELQQAFPEANIIRVASSLAALQALAAYHRRQFHIPVLAITGSNGKTIVKEWLSQLLSPEERIVKSPRSYNSQVGVPLSVWQMHEHHSFGLFEAGISRLGEMEKLRDVLQPTLGLLTNIGPAHDEGFPSRSSKIAEKLKLFAGVQCLFYCRDQQQVHEAVQARGIPAFTWSRHHPADLQILSSSITGHRTMLSYRYQGQEHALDLPFADAASVENALHGVAVMAWRGLSAADIQQRLEKLLPVAMRLEMKEAINGSYLIDDTYNNDLAGLTIALDLLMNQPRQGAKTLILSDLLESGLQEEELYRQVAATVQAKHPDKLIGIGEKISRHQDKFPAGARFYASTADFLACFRPQDFNRETILVKGARVFEFEHIVAAFQRKVHGTVLEVNLDALVHNLNYYRSRLQPETRLMVMVKAFAYGSGSYEIANLLQFHQIDYLAVAYADEGVQLRENGITLPIMVMNPSPDSFAKIWQYRLEPEIYSLEILAACRAAAAGAAEVLPIHIKLDTGMHRLGFTEEELPGLLAELRRAPELKVESAFSHLAGADEALHNDFSLAQIQCFRRMAAQLEAGLGYSLIKHILNSAGIVRFPEHHLDMVRLGIGLYGVEASGLEPGALRTVGRLKTTVSQVKQVRQGDTVGYGRRGIAEADKQIATIAIGYADGYDRRFGNGRGQVLLQGRRCPIIGNVCMDMCMVDVTGLQVQAGEEVGVFGEELTISELAQAIGTIPYELLTSVSTRVKRVFYAE
ncbi:MAG: bifunctional UDP-N-acetylmuramoyl-tripeptide:D-alanyl-D-alanine ligase/alanine racemase [Adhaeribacter sp.]